MNKYFSELFEKFDNLSDDEFDKLLVESGIEDCPYDISRYSKSANVVFKEVYEIRFSTNIMDKGLLEYNGREKIA